ncbi:hypothetical protein [Streptomyces nigrescens]|uniref:hypothetical protein n=1 Tax=Streptomyces nigrescens TaxID=1920 RepID=UPI002251351A|nr:hypothetical protein [Streptomyces libani]MCX5446012.1 hypothetical protein [Streptomyces libani]
MSDADRITIRTIVQTVLGLAAAFPLIVDTAGIPRTAAGVGVTLAVVMAVTRVMQLEQVQKLMPRWLRSAIPDPGNSAAEPTKTGSRPADGGAV